MSIAALSGRAPVETMAEAALALRIADAAVLSGRIAFSLQLLLELGRPVYDLSGRNLMDGWQPTDLVAVIRAQEELHAANGWAHAFDFHRPHTPTPRPCADGGAPATSHSANALLAVSRCYGAGPGICIGGIGSSSSAIRLTT